jgi:hypothetical protein
LAARVAGWGGEFVMRDKAIAARLALSVTTVKRAVTRLRKDGWFEGQTHRGHAGKRLRVDVPEAARPLLGLGENAQNERFKAPKMSAFNPPLPIRDLSREELDKQAGLSLRSPEKMGPSKPDPSPSPTHAPPGPPPPSPAPAEAEVEQIAGRLAARFPEARAERCRAEARTWLQGHAPAAVATAVERAIDKAKYRGLDPFCKLVGLVLPDIGTRGPRRPARPPGPPPRPHVAPPEVRNAPQACMTFAQIQEFKRKSPRSRAIAAAAQGGHS